MTKDEQARMYAEHKAGYDVQYLSQKYGTSTMQTVKFLENSKRNEPREFQVISLGTPLFLQGDAIIVGDVHAPATDWGFAQNVVRVAQKRKITRLIIAGDFFNGDAWSKYPHIMTPPTWAQERDAGRLLLMDWLEVFSEIAVIMGNHDRRMQKANAGEVDAADIFGMLVQNPKITVSNFGYLSINSGGEVYRVTHPRNYGRNQLTVPGQLALKHDCHVIGFHAHHLAKGRDVYGRHITIDGGCLADPAKLAYVQLDDSTSASMDRGFVALQNGVCDVLGLWPYTDWSAVLA